MTQFQLYLWREWREHRSALLALALVLPLVTGLLAWPLARGQVADPLFQSAVAAGFGLVMLVVVGGELLAAERRGRVHGWLERLPGGLDAAFRAKLAFFAGTTVLALLAGFATADVLARFRGTAARGEHSEIVWLGALAIGAWTFAASTWTQRGGLAVLGAALILTLVGFPVWRLVEAGYAPWPWELWGFVGLLVPSALIAACLGYVLGTRCGRGVLASALLGVGPALPLFALALGWSEWRLAERARVDPLAENFQLLHGVRVSRNGRYALAVGQHLLPRWSDTPLHALRIELASGTFQHLGIYQNEANLPRKVEHDMPEDAAILVALEDEQTVSFALDDGELGAWDGKTREFYWEPRGLGASIMLGKPFREVLRDPFRGHDYPREEIMGGYRKIWIRPGRWILQTKQQEWSWFDPDTGKREAWTANRRPLAILQDGGVLVVTAEALVLEHPELGTERPIETHGLDLGHLVENRNGARLQNLRESYRDDGHIVLRCEGQLVSLLVVDPQSGSSWRVEGTDQVVPLARSGHEALVVQGWGMHDLVRLDLVDGSREPLFGFWRRE